MKSKSYLLLFFLALILVFILGVRYGQKVEKTNKIIDYVLSITPRITPTVPISPTPLQYATPSSFLKIKEDPTKSAVILEP